MKTLSFILMSALLLSFSICQKQDKSDSAYFLPETTFAIEVDNDKPSVLYFGATWCTPCKITKRNLESSEVKKELQRFNFKMYNVDVDKKEKEKVIDAAVKVASGIRWVKEAIQEDQGSKHVYCIAEYKPCVNTGTFSSTNCCPSSELVTKCTTKKENGKKHSTCQLNL